jgi:hypothetical protein
MLHDGGKVTAMNRRVASLILTLGITGSGCGNPELASTPAGDGPVGTSGVLAEPGNSSDAELIRRVRSALHEEAATTGLNVAVDVSNGYVRLSGTASTKDEFDRAAALAAAIEGVKGVENRIIVTGYSAP